MESPAVALTASPIPTEIPAVSDVVTESVNMLSETTTNFVASLPVYATRLLMAAVIIVIGWLVLRIGRKLITRFLHIREAKSAYAHQQRETLRSLVISIFNYLVYFVIATVVLSVFGVNVSSIIAVAGVGGVAIGFGAQTLVKDIISGVFLWSEGNITVGDFVQLNGLSGTVEGISLRTTTLRDYNGNLYVVPNGDVRTVTNLSRDYKRALIEVRLNYEESLDDMLAILRDEMERSRNEIPGLRETPQVLGIKAMPGDAIIVEISALCDAGANVDAERSLRLRVKNRFDREGILFPHAPVMATPRRDRQQ